MRKNKKRKVRGNALKITAMVVGITILIGCVGLVLVENVLPNQEFIPKNIVGMPSRVISAVV